MPLRKPRGRGGSSRPSNRAAPGSVHVNFLDLDAGTSRVREAHGDHNERRPAEVKAEYDPDNAFHHKKNIRPG